MLAIHLFQSFSEILFTPANLLLNIVGGVLLLLLLLCSGFMSSAEVAFFSLSPTEVREIKESSSPLDQKLLKLISHSEQLLATILIGNNVVNISIVMVAGFLIASNFDFSQAPVLGFLIQTVLLSFCLLLFGEIIPKVYAQQAPLKFIRSIAELIHAVYNFLAPFSKALMKSTDLFSWMHKRPAETHGGYALSVDDLSKAVELTTTEEDSEVEMINDIVRFYNRTIDEIMVPRIDVVDIEYNWPFRKMLHYALDSGYSRLPVYEGSEDSIKGILYVKDMIPYMERGDDFQWQNCIRPAYFVPENKKVDSLLEELRHEQVHIAVVVDEFGGTCGIVTLEDIIEEIVGEIADEYDEEEELPYIKIADHIYLFEGRASLADMVELFKWDENFFEPHHASVDTLGGLFLEIEKEIPKVGERVQYKNLTLEITQMDRFRILQVKVTIAPTSIAPVVG